MVVPSKGVKVKFDILQVKVYNGGDYHPANSLFQLKGIINLRGGKE